MFFYEGSATVRGNTTFTSNTADDEGGGMGWMTRHAPMGKIAVESIVGLYIRNGGHTLGSVVGMELSWKAYIPDVPAVSFAGRGSFECIRPYELLRVLQHIICYFISRNFSSLVV